MIILHVSRMPWDIPLFSSVALLVLMQGPKINGVSQESAFVIECIRDMVPTQIFNECCMRENNCTISKQQNRGIDCMSRMIMVNYSSYFTNLHDGGSSITENPYQNNNRWHGEVLDDLSEICKRQQKARLQNCIRNELIKRCRYSMLQDRITSQSVRWNQRGDHSPYNTDHYGGGHGDRSHDQRRYHPFMSTRRDQGNYNSRSDYGDSSYYPRGSYNGETDEEDLGYLDGDSSRYK